MLFLKRHWFDFSTIEEKECRKYPDYAIGMRICLSSSVCITIFERFSRNLLWI